MSAADLRSIRRRFSLLLALRFVPTGLFITVFVLLLRDRGLTLAEIGIGTAAQGVVMLFLELPSGGLADALGRKPVLILAACFSLAATSLLLVADSVLLLAAVSSLQGVFRALDSGPLEAWFIDAALAADTDVDIEGALARQNIVICSSIGLGAMLGGVTAATDGFLGIDALVAPLVLGMAVQVVGLIAVITLMDEVRPGRGWSAVRQAVADVPAVVREGVSSIRASSLLTALVVGGGVEDAARLLGPAITAAWVLSALGAAVAPWLVRRYGAGWAGFGLRLGHGLTVVCMGLAAGPTGLIVAYLATYSVHGATAPVHYGMVHRAVESSHRATVVSANSLTSQVGGAVGGIVLGALADATSITTAMFVAAAVLAAAAPLYLVGRAPTEASLEEPIPLNL